MSASSTIRDFSALPRGARRRFGLGSVLLVGGMFVGVALGCGTVKSAVVPGGGHVITCSRGMSDCVGKAEKLCGDIGYTITGGASTTKLLGGPSSSYRQKAESGELDIVCGAVDEVAADRESGKYKLPPRTDVAVAVPVATQVCLPGATQRCVGPAACDGGQVCSPEGTGFGSCDCGPAASTSPATASAPAAAAAPVAGPAPKSTATPSTIEPVKAPPPAPVKTPSAAPAPTPLAK